MSLFLKRMRQLFSFSVLFVHYSKCTAEKQTPEDESQTSSPLQLFNLRKTTESDVSYQETCFCSDFVDRDSWQ